MIYALYLAVTNDSGGWAGIDNFTKTVLDFRFIPAFEHVPAYTSRWLAFFFSFVADWNNFFLPFAVLGDSSQYPIQVGLSNLLSSTPSFNPASGGGGQQVGIFGPELALATLLAVVPTMIVFLVSQRALVRGLVAGAVRG